MNNEASVVLEGEIAAPRRARRFVAEQLRTWNCSDLAEAAALCVSEIVTNAVFHTGRTIEVRMHWTAPSLRVEVRDQSPDSAIPTSVVAAAAEDDLWGDGGKLADATSGRGLLVVASVADVLGERRDGNGKVVWFELRADTVLAADAGDGADGAGRRSIGTIVQQLPDEPGSGAAGSGAAATVRLEAVPVEVAIASDAHLDDLLRELQLLSGRDPATATFVRRLQAVRGVLPFFAPVREALVVRRLRGVATADVTIDVTDDQIGALRQEPDLLAEFDRLDDSGVLLAMPAPADVRAWRRRLVDAVLDQTGGGS